MKQMQSHIIVLYNYAGANNDDRQYRDSAMVFHSLPSLAVVVSKKSPIQP